MKQRFDQPMVSPLPSTGPNSSPAPGNLAPGGARIVNGEYVFNNPGRQRIRTRFPEDAIFIDTSGPIWEAGGYFKADWTKHQFASPSLQQAVQHFIWYRLGSMSPTTAHIDEDNFKKHILPKIMPQDYPLSLAKAKAVLNSLPRRAWHTFRVFYRWAATKPNPVTGFTREIANELDRLAAPKFDPYEEIKEGKVYLEPAEEMRLLELIDTEIDEDSETALRDNALVQLSWEWGVRNGQARGSDERHFHKIEGANGQVYYELEIMRLKQRTFKVEYKTREISQKLGEKIDRLIEQNHRIYGDSGPDAPIFRSMVGGGRISQGEVWLAVSDFLEDAGIEDGNNFVLRHHLGTKMAEQGEHEDKISEVLDHSTRIAARAYIAASPEIGRIKTRALGKSGVYNEIMDQMTGETVARIEVKDPRTIVKGLVATQYIGNIGQCGLDPDTPCSKNPIYSCYTCRKFHPFPDGEHRHVLEALRQEVQLMLGMPPEAVEHNKVIVQLEETIEFVERTAKRCEAMQNKEEK